MTRGAIVVVAARGPYAGKPRPAVVVPSDLFNPTHASVTVCPLTTECVDAPLVRVTLPPGERTGLDEVSQVMVDKVTSVRHETIAREIGRCDPFYVDQINDALRRWLDL
ncbi:MAG: type II toxin-antitoxin system PemK/MazF family toxin [Acidimicrobiia bacterium]|nr:type II toxin-antitoxin system PemK/MazF family toxin [Acidimicrobiia bacterium]